MSKKDNAVAVKEETAVAVQQDMSAFYAENEDTGLNDFSREDLALPFLRILQRMSPEVGVIDGAKPGKILNTVTGEIYDHCTVIPVHYRKSEIEWIPKSDGGGFVAEYTPEEAPKGERIKGKTVLENGHELQTTATYSVLNIVNGVPMRAVIAMSSTQLKKSRKWNSSLKQTVVTLPDNSMRPGAMYSYTWTIDGMTEEKNDLGSWNGWTIARGEQVNEVELLKAALAFRKECQEGTVKIDLSALNGESDAPPSRNPGEDDDIGF